LVIYRLVIFLCTGSEHRRYTGEKKEFFHCV
jgi:hypothetical protein